MACPDLFRAIHKGIRRSLFDLCTTAGALDATDPLEVDGLLARFAAVERVLELHHQLEDLGRLGELIGRFAPTHAFDLDTAHRALVHHLAGLREGVLGLRDGATDPDDLYDGIVAVVGAYLAHLLVEEHEVMPALVAAATVDQLAAAQAEIRSALPPSELCTFLRSMLPAMNPDDRAALLAGLRDDACAEVLARLWATAAEVLSPAELSVVARRIGV